MELDEEEIEKIKKRINDLKQYKNKLSEIEDIISKLPDIDKESDELTDKIWNLLCDEESRVEDEIIDVKIKAGVPAIAIFFEGE